MCLYTYRNLVKSPQYRIHTIQRYSVWPLSGILLPCGEGDCNMLFWREKGGLIDCWLVSQHTQDGFCVN